MTFQESIRRNLQRRRLEQRMALLKTARQKLMAAAVRADEQRATAITDLAAYADVVVAYLWPVWRGLR